MKIEPVDSGSHRATHETHHFPETISLTSHTTEAVSNPPISAFIVVRFMCFRLAVVSCRAGQALEGRYSSMGCLTDRGRPERRPEAEHPRLARRRMTTSTRSSSCSLPG